MRGGCDGHDVNVASSQQARYSTHALLDKPSLDKGDFKAVLLPPVLLN